MMIMPANNGKGLVHWLAGAYPGSVGMLFSPSGWRIPPFYMPYALDNGCFTGWDKQAFLGMISKASQLEHKPLWVVLPDVVGNHDATIQAWQEWVQQIAEYKIPLAFACQDGATPNTVPEGASCLFIGGTTNWKLANAHRFKGVADWLHIGRVNTRQRLDWAKRIGADSVDGTGFFRGDKEQICAMIDFATGRREQLVFRI